MDNPANDKSLTNLCPSCFAETVKSETCPVCGYRPDDSNDDWNRLKAGTTIHGRYIVGKILGQGGFGITYLGLDSLLGFKLAIKEYYPSGLAARNSTSRVVKSASSDAREDFHRGMEKFLEEARILARFEGQPNIVSVRDFFQENGTAYMVMTYLEGRTLLKYLEERGGRISFSEAMETLSPVMDALDEVHASGLIHRDISPDNIFVTHNGQVKLLDFGASKSALNLMQQKSHSVVLKRGYSPPEQYQSRGSLGPWTDVYGMATTLYRAVTGQVPPDSLDRLVEDTLTLDGEMERMLPPLAREGLLFGLSLSPKARPQSMMEFKERLQGKASDTSGRIHEQPTSAGVNDPLISQPAAGKEGQERNSMFFPIVIVLVVLIIIELSFLLYAVSSPERPVAPTASQPQPSIVSEVQNNDPESLFQLGLKYQEGNGVPKDLTKAAELYQKAADLKHPAAQSSLADMYYYGHGVERDYSKAVIWFRKSAEQNYTYAQYSLGHMYQYNQGVTRDNSKAVEWYRKAAAQGHEESKERLDLLLGSSAAPSAATRPTPPAPQEFIRIARLGSTEEIKKALESGASLEARDERYGGTPLMWAAAQNKDIEVLSALLSAGANVNARDNNDGTALLWAAGANRGQEVLSLLLSAGADAEARDRSGDTMKSLLERHSLVSEAQRLLNELGYDSGSVDGKPGSKTVAAVKAFQRSRGSTQNGEISTVLLQMLWEAKKEKEKRIIQPTPPPSPRPSAVSKAQRSDPKSLFDLGKRYEQGNGVPKDFRKAAELYQKAADLGHPAAQNNIGNMYYGQKDYGKAMEWYRKSAEQGDAYAQTALGWMYGSGFGVHQDYSKAVEWYRKGAEQGDADAQMGLGWMYENGLGVPKNKRTAEEWYRKAADQGNKEAIERLGKL